MTSSLPQGFRAAIIGAGGGIGQALVAELVADPRAATVDAFARGGPRPIDVTDEASVAAAAASVEGSLDLVIVATGLLQDAELAPEKRLADLDAARLQRSFAVNAIGPALVLKHFTPRLTRDSRAVVACLSARVGSISDNQLGGWYGYRASKAALNQLVRTAAVELAARRPQTICVALHPGTVDTGLSKPFQRGVAADQLFTPAFAARRLLAVIEGLGVADTGGLFAWDGAAIAF